MLKSYKYRLYPTKAQAELINKHIGSCRFVYNLALEVKNNAYASHRKNISCFELMRQLTDLKNDLEWLREIDSQALQQSILNLDRAFTSFFKGLNNYPTFKKKNGDNQYFRNPHGSKVRIKENRISLPKFTEGVKFAQDRIFNGEIRSTTVSKTPTGKYFVSVLVETGINQSKPKPIKEKTAIGIDLGLTHFAITSNGIKVDNPRHLRKAMLHLKYLQRQASKKKKGSANRKKATFKVARLHERITNQRKDFQHKLSTELINNHDTLCFETLNIDGMIKNRKLSQAINDVGWGRFVDFCKYKAEWKGKNVLQIPTFEPSTKLCNCCGTINSTLTLADREWTCANCLTVHDRDINAAINIKNYSLKNCVGVQRKKSVKLPTLVGALKQKNLVLKQDVAMRRNSLSPASFGSYYSS